MALQLDVIKESFTTMSIPSKNRDKHAVCLTGVLLLLHRLGKIIQRCLQEMTVLQLNQKVDFETQFTKLTRHPDNVPTTRTSIETGPGCNVTRATCDR